VARGGGEGQLGHAWHGRQRPDRDARVRTAAGDARSLTSGALTAAGGRGVREARARVGQRGGAGRGPAVARASGATWHVSRPAEQGRGGVVDRWATTTVLGGSTS
jgi:hypothetical protein